LPAMLARLRHRGPDGEGSHMDLQGRLALGHRRLAVVDPAGGRQPMEDGSSRVWVVFNGEIYNHRALRRRLEERGRRFRSRCDTEVWLHGYLEWGWTGLLDRLEGIWAVALWDGKRRRLHLSRDPVGVKPLLLRRMEDGWAFASELPALEVLPGCLSLNEDALPSFLAWGAFPAPLSPYREVERLLPGEWRILSPGSPPEGGRLRPAPRSSPEDGLEDVLRREVEAQTMADVPWGLFLSGGVDSAVVGECLHRRGISTKAFVLGFEDPRFDERPRARLCARRWGIPLREFLTGADEIREEGERLFADGGEPLADPALLPQRILCRRAREEVTVALGGDGGDELFGGYPTYNAHALARRWFFIPAILWKMLARLAPRRAGYLTWRERFSRLAEGWGKAPAPRHRGFMAYVPPSLLGDPPVLPVDPPPRGWEDGVRFHQWLDLRRYLADVTLQKVDRASMAAGLEARVPLLGLPVIRHVLAMPPGETRGKRALRRLVPWLPKGPKHGFAVPLDAWLRGPWRGWVRERLSLSALRESGLPEPEILHRMVLRQQEGEPLGRGVWALLCWQHWRVP